MHSAHFQATQALVVLSGSRGHISIGQNCKTKLPNKNLKFGIDMARKWPQLSDSGNEFETCENTESNQEI